MDESKDAGSAADAAFARLQELYDRLSVMEARGAELVRARAAAEAIRLEGELRTARTLLAEAEALESSARAAFEQAEADGACGATALDELRRALLHAGSLRGFRIGPAQNAEAALARALAEGGFASAGEARAAMLDDDALREREAEVDSYRRAYAEALARCEALAVDEE